jgi:hypothetical protein
VPPIREGVRHQELNFGPDTVSAMSIADLRQARFSAQTHVAVFSQARTKLLDECAEAWTRQGTDLFLAPFDGLDPLLQGNLEDDKRPADLRPVLEWARQKIPTRRSLPRASQKPEKALTLPSGCVETLLHFGPEQRLCGILCCPRAGASSTVVLIGNTGRDPRSSPGRFSVELARRLATAGISSFRFDFAGIGDSLGPPRQTDALSPIYDLDRSADLSAAIDMLAAMNYRRYAAYGLCAGAYHMLQGALVDSRLTALLLVNLPIFTWYYGDRIEYTLAETRTLGSYVTGVPKLKSWRVVFAKRHKLGSIVRAQFLRLLKACVASQWIPAEWLSRLQCGSHLSPHRYMGELSRRGVKILFLFAPGDIGLEAVDQDFTKKNIPLEAIDGVTLRIVPEFNHLLSTNEMRLAAIDQMIEFLGPQPDAAECGPAQLEHA